MARILELDGLRAVAILLVIGCHYPGFSHQLHGVPSFGWVGVDIFFVLSGYLITTILLGLRSRRTPFRTFYSRRFLRILPPYFAATAFLLVMAIRQHWLVLNFTVSQVFFLQALPKYARDFFLSIFEHPKFHLTHFAPLLAQAHSLLYVGSNGAEMHFGTAPMTYWSLSIEEYFYLFWAPIVLRCSRATIVRVAVCVCLVDMLLRWMDGGLMAYFNLVSRFDTLLYGAFLALLFERWRRDGFPRRTFFFLLSVCAGSVAGMVAIWFAIRPVLGREIRMSPLVLVIGLPIFAIGVASLIGMLLLRAGSDWWVARILRSRIFVFIGTISYTMYLVHIIAGTFVRKAVITAHLRMSLFSQGVIATLLTIVIAYLSWHWLEKPILQWKDRHFPSSPHPPEPALN
ncbi:MAG TPA: acyltransferase [Candidatus Aquilonibacter sp.]|nr:acyltransferase [Candidatus Aquilonibacter sp.]